MIAKKPLTLLSSFMMPVALLGACSQANEVGQLAEPPSDVESNISIEAGKYKPVHDRIKSLEDKLEEFSVKAERLNIMGEDYALYEIDSDEFSVVGELQNELQETQTALLTFVSNPDLNPNGRFSPHAVEIAGSIGDTEKSLAGIRDVGGDFLDWLADAETMEDCRRLHHELQVFRADIANVANPAPSPLIDSAPAP